MQGYLLLPPLLILVLEIQSKREIGGNKDLKKCKLRPFADDLLIVMEVPLEGIEILMEN